MLEEALSFNLPFKRIARRATKHYKTAVNDYLETMQQALVQDTQSKLVKLRQRSVQILLESYDKRQIDDFSVEDLSSTRKGDRIIVTNCKTKKQVACGTVVSVHHDGEGKSRARIRLQEPIVINFKSEALVESHEATTQNGELVPLADTRQEFKLKFDEAQIMNRRDKIERALARFKRLSCSLSLHKNLLGSYKDSTNTKFSRARVQSLSPELRLRGAQIKAVEESMKRRISLIEGVAGSGKSLVAATLAHSMTRFRGKRILLCSPMQTTVDMLAKLLQDHVEDLKIVKLLGESPKNPVVTKTVANKELTAPDCTLDQLVKASIYQRAKRRAARLIKTKDKESSVEFADRLHRNSMRVVKNSSSWLRRKMESKVLAEANIVCCTLIEAGSPLLRDQHFDMLIIDDLQAASEADCMIPLMVKGLKQVTLIGEMRRDIRMALTQKPVVKAIKAPEKTENSRPKSRITKRSISKISPRTPRKIRAKADQTPRSLKPTNKPQVQPQELGGLFERLLSMGLSSVALRSQFRMHQSLAIFPNHQFYLSKLKTDKQTNENLENQLRNNNTNESEFNWLPNKSCSTAFFDTKHASDKVKDIVEKLVSNLIADGVQRSSIGVITNKAPMVNCDGVHVGTIEDFFGLEWDYIILVATPCDEFNKDTGSLTLDYTKDNDSLLIAITRARLGMFVVAEMHRSITENENCQTSIVPSKDIEANRFCENWIALVRYYLANELSVDGSTLVTATK